MEKLNDCLIGKWKWIMYVQKACLLHDLCFVYLVEASIMLNWKDKDKYLSSYSISLLVCKNVFLSINLS